MLLVFKVNARPCSNPSHFRPQITHRLLFLKTACKDTAFHACKRGKIDKKTAQFLIKQEIVLSDSSL